MVEENKPLESKPEQMPEQPKKIKKSKMPDTVKGDKTRTDYDVAYEHDRVKRKVFKLRVIYNKKGCLASGHCVLSDPYNFELDEEFKAILKDGKPLSGVQQGVFVKEIETDAPHLVLNAAKTCTPRVIAVIDMETGKRIAP